MGPNARQGPHQGAHQSMSTVPPAFTIEEKLAAVISVVVMVGCLVVRDAFDRRSRRERQKGSRAGTLRNRTSGRPRTSGATRGLSRLGERHDTIVPTQ